MYDKTITYFCHYKSDAGDVWYPYRLENVDYHNDRGYIMRQYGADSSDSVSLHIAFRKEADNTQIGPYTYLTPDEWDNLPNESKNAYITFRGGLSYDFIYEGTFDDMEPIMDRNYRQGFFNYMKNIYHHVYAVSSVGGPYDLIPHFELLCK